MSFRSVVDAQAFLANTYLEHVGDGELPESADALRAALNRARNPASSGEIEQALQALSLVEGEGNYRDLVVAYPKYRAKIEARLGLRGEQRITGRSTTAHAEQLGAKAGSTTAAYNLSVPEKPKGFAERSAEHLLAAAERRGLSAERIERMTQPERSVETTASFNLDNGDPIEVWAARTVHNTILGPGKGGIRWVADLTAEVVGALAGEMPIKSAIFGNPVGGAKGGMDLDPSKLSTAEKGRAMRAFVRAISDAVLEQHGEVAFGLLRDVPAPDIGTTPPDINLMDVAVDEHIQWLVDQGIDNHDGKVVPKELEDVEPSEDGTQTPYVDRYIELFDQGTIPDLGLLGAFTGKSPEKGGSLGRPEATGFSVAMSSFEAMKQLGMLDQDAERMDGKTVAIHGFGNVAWGAALQYAKLGAHVKAIGGRKDAIVFDEPITPEQVDAMVAYKKEHRTLNGFPGSRTIPIEEFWAQEVDVMAPAAIQDSITPDVADLVQAKLIVEGANGPTTEAAEEHLVGKGIPIVPDVFANAGGVTVSYFEMAQNNNGDRWDFDTVQKFQADMVRAQMSQLFKQYNDGDDSTEHYTLRMAAYDQAVEAMDRRLDYEEAIS